MNEKILINIIIAFSFAIIFNCIPQNLNPIKNIFIFSFCGTLILNYIINNYIPTFFEYFTQNISDSKSNELDNILVNLNPEIKTKLLNYFSQINIQSSNNDQDYDKKIEEAIAKYFIKGKYIDEKGMINNIINSDMKYNQLNPELLQPLGSYDNTFTNKWDHGFTYLSTDKWAPPKTQQPPVCKTEKQCPLCPVATSGYPLGLMEFDNSRKILGPDNININYIKEKLNS